MKEIFRVYMVCYADGYQEVSFLPVGDVLDSGRVEAFEADLREAATWYYPIGETESVDDGEGGLFMATAPMSALVKAWEERGSPKIQGAGTGRSPFQLQDDETGGATSNDKEESQTESIRSYVQCK